MPDAETVAVPLAGPRARLARITRRGAGMTLASAAYWAAVAGAILVARPGIEVRAQLFVVGALLAYPVGYVLNRALGGDLTARGSELRGLVGATALSQVLGWPLVLLLLRSAPSLVPVAIATLMGAHYLPFAWLYRAPAYAALGVAAVATAVAAELAWPARADLAIATMLAALHALAGFRVARRDADAPSA